MTDPPEPRQIKLTLDDCLDPQTQIIIGLLVQVMHQISEIKGQFNGVKAQLNSIEATLKYRSGGTAWERGWQRLGVPSRGGRKK